MAYLFKSNSPVNPFRKSEMSLIPTLTPHQNLSLSAIYRSTVPSPDRTHSSTQDQSLIRCVFDFFFPGEIAASQEVKNERPVHLKNALSRDEKRQINLHNRPLVSLNSVKTQNNKT